MFIWSSMSCSSLKNYCLGAKNQQSINRLGHAILLTLWVLSNVSFVLRHFFLFYFLYGVKFQCAFILNENSQKSLLFHFGDIIHIKRHCFAFIFWGLQLSFKKVIKKIMFEVSEANICNFSTICMTNKSFFKSFFLIIFTPGWRRFYMFTSFNCSSKENKL